MTSGDGEPSRLQTAAAFAKRRPFEVILAVSLLASLLVTGWQVVQDSVNRYGCWDQHSSGERLLSDCQFEGDMVLGASVAVLMFVTLTGLVLARRALNKPDKD